MIFFSLSNSSSLVSGNPQKKLLLWTSTWLGSVRLLGLYSIMKSLISSLSKNLLILLIETWNCIKRPIKKGIHLVGKRSSYKIWSPAMLWPKVILWPTSMIATPNVVTCIKGYVTFIMLKLSVPRLNLCQIQFSSTPLALLIWSINLFIHELNLMWRMLSRASVVVFIQLSFAPITRLVIRAVTFAKQKFKTIIPKTIKRATENPHPK